MKSKLSRLLISLVCIAVMFAALNAVALADETAPCQHTVKLERPKAGSMTPATCVSPASYIVELTCQDCNQYMGEYRQTDPNSTIDPDAHRFKQVTISGDCAGGQDGVQNICTLCGYTETITSGSGHNWQTVTVKATTCGQTDYSYEECTQCGMTRNYQYGSSYFTHTYTKYPQEEVRAATCSVPGEKTQKCDCGEKTRAIPVPTLPHTYDTAVTIQGNCTTKTRTSQTCTVCKYENVLRYGSYVHNYVAQDIVTASCTTSGIRASRCTNCGAEEWSQTISALGHSASPWYCDASRHWQSCTRCGIELASESHNGSRANDYCTTKVTCATCGYVMVPAGRHAASVVSDSGDDTYHDLKCANCSYVSSRAAHTYVAVDGDCTKGRVCSVCGHRTSGNGSHPLSSAWTSAGISQHGHKCTYAGCAYMQTEDHTWTDWTITQQPTTTSVGTEARSCTKCSSSMVRSVPKLTASTTETAAPSPTSAPATTDAPAATTVPADAPTSAPASAPTTAPANTTTSAPASAATRAPASAATSAPASAATKAPASAATKAPASATTKAPASATTKAPASAATKAPASASTSASAPASTPRVTSASAGVTATATPAPAMSGSAATAAPTAGTASATAIPADNSVPSTMPETAPASSDAPLTASPDAPETDAENASEASDDTEAPLPSETTAGANCAAADVPCTETEFTQAGLLMRVCAVCGRVTVVSLSDEGSALAPVFVDVPGFTFTGAAQEGQLILRAADLYDEAAGATDAFLAFTAAWEQDGLAQTFDTPVQVSLPLAIGETEDENTLSVPTADFKLVRIDVEAGEEPVQVQTELDFSYEDGILTFEMDRVAVYLLIPA